MARDEWTEPGPVEVAAGVHRIPLPLPSDALRAVNVYAIEDGDRLVLIDSGWALRESREALAAALRHLDRDLKDISRFLVTHIHRDHYTQAVALRREFGHRVALGIGERPSLSGELLSGKPLPQYADKLLSCGAKVVIDRIGEAITIKPEPGVWEEPDEWLSDGETIHLADRTLRVVETPGHTQGHVVFVDSDAGLLFAGDHVLPHITPSIGFEAKLPEQPLRDYLGSLKTVRAMPDLRLLPAHGAVSDSTHARVDELLDHHERRLDAIAAALGVGAANAYEVARLIGWTRRERHFDELDVFNQMLAVMETGAHLDLLVLRGRARSETLDGVVHYGLL
ncbi:MBL fold metallo-hydrolase [Allokutzneria sp. A3M-2-11 16]|uniref:MBL fold metallo-hydrolase n=1 Tax=Allokutzneria sp. A3M-2-11 16 TaxID=2962043 RepID=UPI0020B7BB9F|nr:MBL fold metallo-hydrolase [Allokutzneria sp. A3M-2-11 16]MCP3805501.1 MBL fold metallo-hydrolase [Allokutzneria sp. A3M-2-11 16]